MKPRLASSAGASQAARTGSKTAAREPAAATRGPAAEGRGRPAARDDVLVLQEFDWAGLIKAGFFENMPLGVVGVILGLASLSGQTANLPSYLLIDPWLSFLCIVLAFTRVWKTVREEHETTALWELVLDASEVDQLRDRVFEIPYVFSCMILPLAAISPQAFMVTLVVFYLSDNYYNWALARSLATRGRRILGLTTEEAGSTYLGALALAARSSLWSRKPVTHHGPTDAMIGYFRARYRMNSAFVLGLVVGFVAIWWLMVNGSPAWAWWLALAVLGAILIGEVVVEPARNRDVTFADGPEEFHEIVDPADPLLDDFWLPLYRDAFPADERVGEEEHRAAVLDPDRHVLVGFAVPGTDDEPQQPVSMARYDVVRPGEARAYAYLMYMAVDASATSRGYGRRLFREIVRRAEEDAAQPALLILEVQPPDQAGTFTPEQRPDRRFDFYGRQGCVVLGGVEYLQRVDGHAAVPMRIMARRLTADATAADAFAAAHDQFADDIRQVGALSLGADA